MGNMTTNMRRRFIQGILALATTLVLPQLFRKTWAAPKAATKSKEVPLPAGQVAVPAADPIAQAIGYRANVADIDYTRYPQRKKPEAKNQFCKNCALYNAVNEGWGKCTMISSGLVAAEGWCGSWNKKS